MMTPRSERWYFTDEQMANTPSIRYGGITSSEELYQRQLAAKFINELGSQLKLSQLCMNTAIVYMHRFYMFHSFQRYHRAKIAACALFLAAKVEEQPRKLENVLRVFYMIRNPPKVLSTNSREYVQLAEELVANENLLLQTLGFEVRAEHPHTSIITCCQRVKATKDLTKTAYMMATNSLHLTTFCLRYRPSIVACVCIYTTCKWTKVEILKSVEGREWWTYVDENVTINQIDDLTKELMFIMERAPSQISKLLVTPIASGIRPTSGQTAPNSVGPVSSTSSSSTSSADATTTLGTPSTSDLESGEIPSTKRIRLDTNTKAT